MNFLYRNRAAVKVPKVDDWQYQQNVLDAKMQQCHQSIFDARMAGNYQALLDSMTELEMIVEEQKRRLKEVRALKDEARSRLRRLEMHEEALVEKEGEWANEGWIKEEKEKARFAMTQTIHDMLEAVDPLAAGKLDAVPEDSTMAMEIEQSLW